MASAYLAAVGRSHFGGLDEEPKVAAHIAHGDGYLTPMDASPSAEPTCWMPPGYPYLMAGVYLLFGIATPASLWIMLGLNALFFSAAVCAAYQMGRLLFSPLAGWAAGALVLLHPLFLLRTAYFWDTYLSLAMFAWLIAWAVVIARRGASVKIVLLYGAALGLLALINPSYMATYPILVLVACGRVPWSRRIKLSACALATFIVVLIPWTIRGYIVHHEIYAVRNGPELEMWIGNQAGHSGWIELESHPSVNIAEGDLMRRLGEKAYFKLCEKRFIQEYDRDPSAFWLRSLRRFGFYFAGDPAPNASIQLVSGPGRMYLLRTALDWTVLLLAILGAIVAIRSPRRVWWIVPLILLCGLPYYFTHVSYRYTMPARFLMLVCISALIPAAIHVLQRRKASCATETGACEKSEIPSA